MSEVRRSFLRTASGAVAAGASGFGFGNPLPSVSAQETKVDPSIVSFDSGIEPLVRLIEDTQREVVLERVAEKIRRGASYQEVLAALLLAGIRNVQPRPAVGFKFHCVLVVNSCHLASMAGPDSDRWLPIFWAIDYFKSSQADEKKRSGWRMKPVDESQVSGADASRRMFIDAMDNWDVEKADVATAGLLRTVGKAEVFELLARYAARDYRSIGHKAIYLANAWRTLQVIGYHHAEPVVRSLVFALLNHNGEANPAENDWVADRAWRQTLEPSKKLPDEWLKGRLDDGVPPALFDVFRNEAPQNAIRVAADAIGQGVSPQSVWDGVFCGAGELLMRQPGIIGLHGLTTANAMHYLWNQTADDSIRRRLLLQACAFNPHFRKSAIDRGDLAQRTIETFDDSQESGDPSVADIVQDISRDRMRAARKVHSYLERGGSAFELVDDARRQLFFKGRDAHDYKFASAVLEDFRHVSPTWRNKFMATSVFNLKGSGHRDSKLVERTRSALA